MKIEGALEKRFFRHHGIYRSDVSLLLVNLGRSAASRWSALAQVVGRAGRNTPFPSSAMSSGRLFLDRVARQHCPSPLHRHHQHKTIAASNGRIYHRTVTSVLTVCLSKRGNPSTRTPFRSSVRMSSSIRKRWWTLCCSPNRASGRTRTSTGYLREITISILPFQRRHRRTICLSCPEP